MARLRRRKDSPTWYVVYRTAAGKERTISTGCKDKQAAQRVLATYEEREALLRHGVLKDVDVAAQEAQKQPAQKHLDAYLADLERRKRGEAYLREVRWQLEGFLKKCSVRSMADFTPAAVRRRVQQLRDKAPRTQNSHLGAIRSWAKWCILESRLREDPTASIRRAAEHRDTRRVRREASRAEIRKLLDASRPVPEKYAYYLLLLWTGMRVSEVQRMCWADVQWNEGLIAIPRSKGSGRPQYVTLHPELASALEAIRGDRGDPCFGEWLSGRDQWKKDFKAAGIKIETDEGRLDRHALRATFVTRLARSGVPLSTAQRAARHRHASTTDQHYVKLGREDVKNAVEGLPNLDEDCTGICTVTPGRFWPILTTPGRVHGGGLEPPRVSPPDPKSGASAIPPPAHGTASEPSGARLPGRDGA